MDTANNIDGMEQSGRSNKRVWQRSARMVIVFIVVGMMVGGLTAGVSGGFFGAFVGYLMWQSVRQQQLLQQLRNELNQLKTARAPSSNHPGPLPQASRPTPTSAAQPSYAPADSINETPFSGELPSPVQARTTVATPVATHALFPNQIENTTADDLPVVRWIKQYFTTGNTLVRIGVIILFFGVAFLAKYAAESGLLPIELRMAGIALGGLVMISLGWYLRGKNLGYALAMQGGGVGILYLTIFAAMRLYNLIPPPFAFALLLGLCVLSSILAVLQNSRSLAILASSGGFVAPVLTSTGAGSHVMLFSYYALLNAGILGIAWFKAWRVLNLVGFAFTFVIATTWGVFRYTPELFSATEPFLILFFVFYLAISVLYALRQPIDLRGYVDGTLVFGTPIVAFGLQFMLVRNMEYGLAYSAITLCVVYILLAYGLFRFVARYNPSDGIKLICESFLAIGVVFGTVAVPLALDDQWTAAAWALEGCALIYVAIRQHRTLAYYSGIVLQMGAAWFVLQQMLHAQHQQHWVLLNGAYLSGVLIAIAGIVSAYSICRNKANIAHYLPHTDNILLAWGVAWWLLSGLYEIDAHTRREEMLQWLLYFGVVTSIAAHVIGKQVLSWRPMHQVDRGLIIFMSIVFALSAINLTHPLQHPTWLAWLVSVASYYWLLKRNDQPTLEPVQQWQHGAVLWLVAMLLTWESHWQVRQTLPSNSVWSLVTLLLVPSILLAAVTKSVRAVSWPFATHSTLYLSTISLPFAVYLVIAILIGAIYSDGDPTPLNYMPLLNPLDIACTFGITCILVWRVAIARHKISYALLDTGYTANAAMGALAFIVITMALLRTVHHWTNVPFEFGAMMRSNLAQTSLTLLWSLLAMSAMLLASKQQWRTVWLVGAALIGVVVSKLFLVDLSNVGTMERIVSFIGAGLLLLGVGYFAPLPPKIKVPENA